MESFPKSTNVAPFAPGEPAAPGHRSSSPRLLILPPQRNSPISDPRDAELARALVLDITIALCRSRLYEVIAPFTARQLVSGLPSNQVIPVDYVVRTEVFPCTGPIPLSQMRVEIFAGVFGDRIWMGEVELRTGELQDLHHLLSTRLADEVCGRIGSEELRRFRRSGAASAYTHYLLATRRESRNDLASLLLAQKSLTRSIQLAPDFVPALSQMARTKTLEWLERGTEDRALLREASSFAHRAHRYEPADSASLREIGHAALYQHDLAAALEHYEAAQSLAPNHADLLADQADVLTHMSRHAEAETLISRALSLNPLAPDDYYWIGGAVSFFMGDYQRALGRLTAMRSPGLALRLMAACAAMSGDAENAASYREQALARDPSFTVSKWGSLYPEPDKADTAHYFSALKLAGFG